MFCCSFRYLKKNLMPLDFATLGYRSYTINESFTTAKISPPPLKPPLKTGILPAEGSM